MLIYIVKDYVTLFRCYQLTIPDQLNKKSMSLVWLSLVC